MIDPTYNLIEIKKNTVWHIAWLLSEWFNHNAPIGWSTYIVISESIHSHFNINPKIME